MGEPKHTVFAGQAITLADLFKYTVGKQRLTGTTTYAAELSAPDGPSTAGGKQALQHIKLTGEGQGATLVMGTANLVDKQAELRTHAHMDQLHRQRFKGVPFDVDQATYDAFLGHVRAFFVERQFAISVVDAQAAAEPATAAPRRPTGPLELPPASATRLRVAVTMATTLLVALMGVLLLRR